MKQRFSDDEGGFNSITRPGSTNSGALLGSFALSKPLKHPEYIQTNTQKKKACRKIQRNANSMTFLSEAWRVVKFLEGTLKNLTFFENCSFVHNDTNAAPNNGTGSDL